MENWIGKVFKEDLKHFSSYKLKRKFMSIISHLITLVGFANTAVLVWYEQ